MQAVATAVHMAPPGVRTAIERGNMAADRRQQQMSQFEPMRPAVEQAGRHQAGYVAAVSVAARGHATTGDGSHQG